MATKNPGIPEYRSTAVMWVFAVAEAERHIRSVKEENLTAHIHAGVRAEYEKSSGRRRELLKAQADSSTSVIQTSSLWRMTLARYSLLAAAAQLQKCVDALRKGGVNIPEIPNEGNIKLLRDVGEHWEQVTNGKSLKRLRSIRPDERTGGVSYGLLPAIDIGGGLTTIDILRWAAQVDLAVRESAATDGQVLLHADDSAEHLFESQDPMDL